MGKFISKFDTVADFAAFSATTAYSEPHVTLIKDGTGVQFIPYDYSKDYLTTVALGDGTISFNIWKSMGTEYITSISYSTNGGDTWTTVNNTNNKQSNLQITVNVSEGDKVLWKGDAQQLGFYDMVYYGDYAGSFFSSDCEFNVQGNVMSMLYGDDFVGEETLEHEGEFAHLFDDCDGEHACLVVSAEHMVLPATTLANYCYDYMFYNCISLTTAPSELPATTLANYCYDFMFSYCTNLTTAPELPATTLAAGCYNGMFQGCASLAAAPVLPATTLAAYCYGYMFQGCRNLNSIKCLATNISANNCTSRWAENVAASGTFTKAASMSSWTTGTDGIPSGWTVVDA